MNSRIMPVVLLAAACAVMVSIPHSSRAAEEEPLQAGFAEEDITPQTGAKEKPVYMAGFGQNRKATGVHDPLFARAVVLQHAEHKIALVSIDLVGFFHSSVVRVREKLAGFEYVLVSSTHNHEGPDTLGLWGPNAFKSGVDPEYLKMVEDRIVKAVKGADKAALPVRAVIGAAKDADLLHDGREPYVKHDELVAVRFVDPTTDKSAGLVVQWNCHPETLSDKNTEISADFVGATVKYLKEKHHCPVVYLTGTVGGLMTSLHVEIKDENGKVLEDGTWEKTAEYGRRVGQLADKALKDAKPAKLTPLEVKTREVFLPLDNKLYLLGRQLGVLEREGFVWKGDPYKAEAADSKDFKSALCVRSEVGWLKLGDLEIAAIPGEIYPELILDKVQDPPDPGADFPDAPIEPAIYKQLRGKHHMVIGLANDEIGYIIPKRQWDEKPPYCYGRMKPQYGEINSLGPETAPLICQAFKDLVAGKGGQKEEKRNK
jgi:hypothetical protein